MVNNTHTESTENTEKYNTRSTVNNGHTEITEITEKKMIIRERCK